MKNNYELESTVENYFQTVIKKSWTWAKLTEREKFNFIHLIDFDKIKGAKNRRIETLNLVYHAFLVGLGYKSIDWRKY